MAYIALCGPYAAFGADASRDSSADEALYMKRFEALGRAARLGQGLDQYDTLETVVGAHKVQPLRQAAPNRRSISIEALSTARAYARQNNSESFLVWRAGALQESSYFGTTTPDTLIVSRSLAKPITAILIGRAIALGKIRSLDQPVADFITEWRGKPQEKMLIRHLLDMRSGLLRQSASMDPNSPLNRAYLHPRHDEVIIRDYPLTDEPGTRYEYANATAEMVAPVIERATGMRYADFLGRELLAPIGAAGGKIWVNRPGGMAHSGCCLLLPTETWMRVALLLLNDGRANDKQLLPTGYVRQMATGSVQNPWYGLGIYVAGTYRERRGFANSDVPGMGRGVLHSEPYLAGDLFLFDGNGDQVVYIVPSEKMVVLRVGPAPPKTTDWDNAFLPNTLMRGIVRRPGESSPTPQARRRD
ncbi:MAG: beta-lactamase family protein [Pseudomonadales bacterium]|nr:beta-lactamase family protein [Pseudomonadales bacterium]